MSVDGLSFLAANYETNLHGIAGGEAFAAEGANHGVFILLCHGGTLHESARDDILKMKLTHYRARDLSELNSSNTGLRTGVTVRQRAELFQQLYARSGSYRKPLKTAPPAARFSTWLKPGVNRKHVHVHHRAFWSSAANCLKRTMCALFILSECPHLNPLPEGEADA